MSKQIRNKTNLTLNPTQENLPTPPYLVQAGNHWHQVGSMAGKRSLKLKNKLLHLPVSVASALKLPASAYLPYYHTDQVVFVGPVIGILTTALRSDTGLPGGKKQRIFREMILAARKRGLFIYLFSSRGMRRIQGTVAGVTLDQQGRWVQGSYPRPDIVYNRIRLRKIENRPGIQVLLAEFARDPNIYLFNSRFLNKWEVYQAVSGKSPVSCLFPVTVTYNRLNLESMIRQYRDVFLKPENGSLGKGIIKVCQTTQNRYRFAESKNPELWVKCRSIDDLYKALLLKNVIPGNYVVQSAVNLCKLKGRVFDVRAEFQKDGTGGWVVTGAAVRVAGKDRFVTHIPNGGRAAGYQQVVGKVFSNPATKISLDDQLRYICEAIPPHLENTLALNLAVLSMDIAIDTDGKMWILEVNSKPSSFDEPDIRARHVELFVDYCIYIAREKKRQLKRKDLI